MPLASSPTRFTPEDLLEFEQGDSLYELVDGQLVEKSIGPLMSETIGIICTSLVTIGQREQHHATYLEQTYQCFPHDPDLVRRPDVSLIVAARLSQVPEEGHIPITPDLVVEVISPNDTIYKFDEKLADYRHAGIRLVWQVNPKFRYIRVHQSGHPVQQLEETDLLTGQPALQGFSIRVKELLPPVRTVA